MKKHITSSQTIIENFSNRSVNKKYSVGKNTKATIVLLIHGNVEVHVDVLLEGKGAEVQILGAIVGLKDNKIKLTTLQHHKAPRTTSDLWVKSVLDDKAYFNYKGLIKVDKDAQITNAYQQDDNLMLSSSARVDTKPALEILANDVCCTHGATTGNIDDTQMFYLKSRGISQKKATELIVSGFLTEVVEKIEDNRVREKLISQIINISN